MTEGNWNGQNIEMECDYVDVIAPMFYPSHFSRDFLGELPYPERLKRIYEEGTARALSITGNRSIIRPPLSPVSWSKPLRLKAFNVSSQ